MHSAVPEVGEDIKWGVPAFLHHGILVSIASFKAHTAVRFPKETLLADSAATELAKLRRLASVDDLPSDAALHRIIRHAAELDERGVKAPRSEAAEERRRIDPPEYMLEALRRHPGALAAFEALSPSHRGEYVEWIVEAKGEETRARRLATAVQWIAEGKPRNWKYARWHMRQCPVHTRSTLARPAR